MPGSASQQSRVPAPGGPILVEFRGSASEYFGIWIVNLLLSILTIGVYSAWATVRARRYFYRNTLIEHRAFDYHATGRQILIGRIVVVVVLVAMAAIASIPPFGPLVYLAALPALPWLVSRGLRFNARQTSWSNVRFGFDGGYWGAFRVYMLYPVLAALTVWIAGPFAARATRRYVVGHHALGRARFAFDAPVAGFYRALGAALLWALVVLLAAGAVAAPYVFALVATQRAGAEPPPELAFVPAIIAYGGFFLAVLPASTIYAALVRNVVFDNATLEGGHRFRSEVPALGALWIGVSNALAVIVSVGLLFPWAQVRWARFLAAHTTVLPAGSLDDFVSVEAARGSVIGDAYAEVEGLDLGLPV